jgi:hypothetical protein
MRQCLGLKMRPPCFGIQERMRARNE